jgi:cation:H+ antiporter
VSPLGIALAEFFACAALIGIAGTKLVRYGGVVGAKTGLSGTWVGLVLIGVVTSLPELITGVSAVTVAGAPDIAVGDALGSCVFNLLLFVLLDLLHRRGSIYDIAGSGHVLAASFGLALIAVAGASIVLGSLDHVLAVGPIGIYVPVLLAGYALGMRTTFRYERRERQEVAADVVVRHPEITLRRAAVGYAVAATVVVIAGAWLPFVGARIAETTGWGDSFVGTLFVAFATSIPEIAVSLSAIRAGSVDMAIGNLLGSNIFDMAILALDDIAFTDGALLAHVSPLHATTALAAILMTGIVSAALVYRAPRGRTGAMTLANALLVAVYVINSYVLFGRTA